MRRDVNKEKVLPEPVKVYYETAINAEGEEYTYPVRVFAPQPNPTDNLNPAFSYSGK